MDALREENFRDYKKAEQKAIEIIRDMKSVSAKKTDIELALVVAIFELHKGELPAGQVAAIVHDHLKSLAPFYSGRDGQAAAMSGVN